MSIIALESHIQKLTEDLEHSHLLSDVLVDMITDELISLHAQLYYEKSLESTQTIPQKIFKVSQEEWEQLNKALDEPPSQHVIDGLKRLFKDK